MFAIHGAGRIRLAYIGPLYGAPSELGVPLSRLRLRNRVGKTFTLLNTQPSFLNHRVLQTRVMIRARPLSPNLDALRFPRS